MGKEDFLVVPAELNINVQDFGERILEALLLPCLDVACALECRRLDSIAPVFLHLHS
jgi:hypothetical protein